MQGQDRYPCRTAVDQRSEQTINRDAKTSGGIKYFASDPRSILKWTLNRSTQARNTQARYDLADINCSEDVYKALRPSHILKSEQLAEKLINVMTEEFLNPFDESLDSGELYNLSSGIPLTKEMVNQILGVKEIGQTCYQNLLHTRLQERRTKFMIQLKDKISCCSKIPERKFWFINNKSKRLLKLTGIFGNTSGIFSKKMRRLLTSKTHLSPTTNSFSIGSSLWISKDNH